MFEHAIKQGTALRSKGAKIPRSEAKLITELVEKAKANTTKAISIRLPVADLDRAREIAAKQGTGYQTILKRATHEDLKFQ